MARVVSLSYLMVKRFLLSRSFGFFVISGISEVGNTGDFFILLTVAWLGAAIRLHIPSLPRLRQRLK
jgi:hypothetical protein